MELPDFQRIVERTIAQLPPQFRKALRKDVLIAIEELPASGSRTLLGLFEGLPVTAWGRDFSGKLPEKITLYRANIEAYARTPEEIPEIVRTTLLHEIAHFFGYDHDKIREMEKRWRAAPGGQAEKARP